MTWSADDVIESWQRRHRLQQRREQATVRSEGWRSALTALAARSGGDVAGASDWMQAFVARPLRPPPRATAALTRWQVVRALLRQRWEPDPGDDRRAHWSAIAAAVVAHLLLLAYWMFMAPLPPPPPQADEIVPVEYIGIGTPAATGGGRPAPQPTAQTSPPPRPASPATAPATPETPAISAAAAAPAAPAAATAESGGAPLGNPDMLSQERVPTPPAVTQPLQTAPTPVPQAVFAVPPPAPVPPPSLPQRTVTAPDLAANVREIAVEDAAPLPAVTARQAALPAAVAPLRTPALAPPQALPLRATPPASASASSSTASAPRPSAATDSAPSTSSAASARPASSSPSTASASAPPAPGNRTPSPGAGPRPTAAAGGWPSPQRGDDWGVGTRNRPGGQGNGNGVFNADGTPRLGGGRVDGGYPPGYDAWGIDRVDRNGTWLKRPPANYRGTRFDAYWVPSGTLLQEWVRQGVRTMEITIPGTSKKITCVVSLLQLGGACGVTDPNLRDEPATARPPPPVPFKRDLFEDPDALGPPGSAPPPPPPAPRPRIPGGGR